MTHSSLPNAAPGCSGWPLMGGAVLQFATGFGLSPVVFFRGGRLQFRLGPLLGARLVEPRGVGGRGRFFKGAGVADCFHGLLHS